MVTFWKVIITVFLLYTIVIDGNRVRRRRRQTLSPIENSINSKGLSIDSRILNARGPSFQRQDGQNEILSGKSGARQYYPYQGQMGYGNIQGLNYPYAGAGLGAYQYGYGIYGQYGNNYNQYPGSSNYYSGYNMGGYNNRPGYYASNYYPSAGNYYGGYFWNNGKKQYINIFTLFLSLIFSLVICVNL